MEPKRIYRDESTPDRKEIWTFVERAAARSGDAPRNTEGQSGRERGLPTSEKRVSGSGQE
jgi:hypothetical protein